MKKLVEHLKEQFDYILLDCPAGIEQGFKKCHRRCGSGARRHNAGGFRHPRRGTVSSVFLEASGFERIDLVINRMRYEW